MSVINQMLKDLEQRRAQGFDNSEGMLDDLDADSNDQVPVKKRSKVWPVFFIFLFTASAATWFYLEEYSQQDKKINVVETKPEVVAKPKAEVYKSVVQEIAPVEKVEIIEPAIDESIVADKQVVEESVAESIAEEIVISTILPSPVRATGNREILTVFGRGFIAPLEVTMEWNDGREFKKLEPWQVKIISESELQLHVNLGKAEDDWRLLIKQHEGTQQADYKFTVLAMALPEVKPVENVLVEPEPASSFSKTNRSLSKDEQVRLEFSKASLLMQQGKVGKAKESLRQVLALDFAHLQARQTLAAVLFREQAYDEAIEVLELAGIQHPNHVPFRLLLARIYTERGQDPLAVDLLERMQPAVAPNSEYYALLAALYQRGAQYKKAAEIYKKLLASFPSRAIWWMGLGLSLQSLQQNEDALAAYNKSLQTQGLTAELRRFINTRIAQLSS